MHEISSVSLFVGTNECNAYCGHCAGTPLRKYAPKIDGVIDEPLIRTTLDEVYERGARYVSLSSSGEPTLSPQAVTQTLEILYSFEKRGMRFNPINLYSNGIRIGEEKDFCDEYFPIWKELGLTTVYITVHNIDEEKNAAVYGVQSYPPLETIIDRLKKHDFRSRANIILSKKTVNTLEDFISTTEHLLTIGFSTISAWPIRNHEDELDEEHAPTSEELRRMEDWIQQTKHPIRLLGETSRQVYEKGQKLTLFPDGTLSNTWCNW